MVGPGSHNNRWVLVKWYVQEVTTIDGCWLNCDLNEWSEFGAQFIFYFLAESLESTWSARHRFMSSEHDF